MKARLLSLRTILFAGVSAVVTGAVAANFPTGTYVYYGAVKDYRNALYTSEDNLKVQVVAADGTILAEGPVLTAAAGGEAYNFRLSVPLSTTATDKTAAVGDQPNCVVVTESGLTAGTSPLPPILRANDAVRVTLSMVATTNFPSSGSEAVDGRVTLPVRYLEEIAAYVRRYGKGVYDPDADWDGDGMSNYAEYVAGTWPFDGSDALRITDFAAARSGDPSARHRIGFEYVGGHVYVIASAADPKGPWTTARIATDPVTTPQQETVVYPASADEEPGVATIYLAPVVTATNRFFKVEVK